MIKRRNTALLCCLFIILTLLPGRAKAACSHSSLGTQFSEAEHPHAYYRTCNACGEKIYTGGYATKAHGDGSWGSGTCPDCGYHSYGTTYSEAEHPHACYRTCVCGDVLYTGEYITKAHGDGSWGSGTCPDCGAHSYLGRTCSSPGVCSCGATIAPLNHSYGSNILLETTHPHRYYRKCINCGDKEYTGEKETLPHGDGTMNTCRECGDHLFEPSSSILPVSHPHREESECILCGETISHCIVKEDCTTCRNNMDYATNTTTDQFVFTTLEGEDAYIAPLYYVIDFSVTYENNYSNPFVNSLPTITDLPQFASFISVVSAEWELSNVASFPASVYYTCSNRVTYYSSSNDIMRTQQLNGGIATSAFGTLYTISEVPSYAIASAAISMDNVVIPPATNTLDVKTFFN